MKGRTKNLVMGLLCGLVLTMLMVVGYSTIQNETAQRIFQMFGGQMPEGIIQFLTFAAFFWGMFEIRDRMSALNTERKSFGYSILPETEHYVLSPDDINDLRVKMVDYDKEHKFLLTDVIRKACTKFRANKSVSDVMGVVSSQIRINLAKAESSQSMVRYLAWAIPSVGFIGTILGIAKSLGLADQAGDPEQLGQITAYMYVAFDTTLVALILSIVMMLFFHNLQEREENLHTDMEEYVIENLVNRINLE